MFVEDDLENVREANATLRAKIAEKNDALENFIVEIENIRTDHNEQIQQ